MSDKPPITRNRRTLEDVERTAHAAGHAEGFNKGRLEAYLELQELIAGTIRNLVQGS